MRVVDVDVEVHHDDLLDVIVSGESTMMMFFWLSIAALVDLTTR